MGCTEDKEASIKRASEAEYNKNKEKRNRQRALAKANHIISWVVGNLFALTPLVMCGLGIFLHSDNKGMVENFKKFFWDFFSSGSFLWVSITMLVMSLIDLFLYGYKKTIPEKSRLGYKIFLIVSIVLVLCSMAVFSDNIGNPINVMKMQTISIIGFVFFAIASGIVSFKIVSEVY